MTALREPIKVFGDVLLAEMALQPSQIILAFQKYQIPKTEGIFISLSYLDTQVISVGSVSVPSNVVGMIEYQSATLRHTIQVDLMSFDDSARLRRAEVLMALGSVYSQQQQSANNIQIARLPTSFVDISNLEETQFLNRYAVTFACTALALKTQAPPYFDSFEGAFVESQQTVETPFSPEEAPFNV